MIFWVFLLSSFIQVKTKSQQGQDPTLQRLKTNRLPVTGAQGFFFSLGSQELILTGLSLQEEQDHLGAGTEVHSLFAA